MLLTRPEDGTQADPVYRVEEYGARYVEGADPGPTIQGAWERWIAARGAQPNPG